MPNQEMPFLFVGSVPLSDADEVFSLASEMLSDHLHCVPDGETGVRSSWLGWQRAAFEAAPFLARAEESRGGYGDPNAIGRYLVTDGADALTFGPLGYVEAACASYARFVQMRAEGKFAPRTRFQISLPTPLAPLIQFIEPKDHERVRVPLEEAFRNEIMGICDMIPHHDLAIQWDVAVEFAILEGVFAAELTVAKTAANLASYARWIPDDALMGFHFCYGDSGHKHFKEPEDMALLVDVANAAFERIGHDVDWLHMPVPRARDDAAYFAPLARLNLPLTCQLYLGLIHRTDGLEGAARRIAAARRFATGFGVATECGWGRRPPDTIRELTALCAAVAGQA